MRKKFWTMFCGQLILTVIPAFAENPAAPKSGPEAVSFFAWTVVAAAFGLAIAAAVCGIAQSRAIDKAVEGIARQPEATGQIQTAMILGLAFIESLVIYVLLIALILLFFNPFTQYLVH